MAKPLPALDAVLRRVSRDAVKTYKKCATVGRDPHDLLIGLVWMAWDADNKEHCVQTPMGDADDRDKIVDTMRKFFRERRIVRYAVLSEAWIGSGGKMRPSENPDRREVVYIAVEDASGERIFGIHQIFRPKGRKAYLGKLEVTDVDIGGRFCELLLPDYSVMSGDELIAAMWPKTMNEALSGELSKRLTQGEPPLRRTFDLDEKDEGTRFFAHTPGAPLAVIGQRASDGELYVEGFVAAAAAAALTATKGDAAECGIEIVGEQEAERLIGLVMAKLHNSTQTPERRTLN